ncbi:MAG: AAA family ATPase [Candidatus Omnitrophota bacterium]
MGDVIVVAGKGGTGKTTVCAALTLMLAKRKDGSVLAVDADPNSNLSEALCLGSVGTISDIIDEVSRNPDSVPKNMGKDAFIEYKIHSDISENDGFDLLVMGRPEGQGCYCYINNVLRNCLGKLIAHYRFVVIDNEAGMEHFSRKTMRSCDQLLVVSDQTQAGLRSGKRIFSLIDELGISAKRRFLIVNRAEKKENNKDLRQEFGVDGVFTMPFDEELYCLSVDGGSISRLAKNSEVIMTIERIGEELWPMS